METELTGINDVERRQLVMDNKEGWMVVGGWVVGGHLSREANDEGNNDWAYIA